MHDWMSLLLLPTVYIIQEKEEYDWWEGLVHTRTVWRSSTMATGGLCVMMAGTCRMPRWCVVNWAMAQLWLHWLIMEGEVVQFGKAMYAAMVVKPTLLSVPLMILGQYSVNIGKMQE